MVVFNLSPVLEKFHRAESHLDEFVARVDQMVAITPIGVKGKREGSCVIAIAQLPTPLDTSGFAVIAGDLVANLRAALDYLAWQLVLSNGATPNRSTNWPCARTEDAWNAAAAGALKGIATADVAEIKRWQPFVDTRAEPNLLDVLDYVNNFNKHRVLPVAFAAPASISFSVELASPATGVEQFSWEGCWDALEDQKEVGRICFENMTMDFKVALPATIAPAVKLTGFDRTFTGPPGWGYDLTDLVELVRRIIASFDATATQIQDVNVPTRSAGSRVTWEEPD